MKILLVEDSTEDSQKLCESMMRESWIAEYCPDATEGRRRFPLVNPSAAVIDLMLPPGYSEEGLALAEWLHEHDAEMPIVLVTRRERGMTQLIARIMRSGVHHVVCKDSIGWVEEVIDYIRDKMADRRSSVFLSHGHNELLLLKLKNFIEKELKQQVIVLAEQPSAGKTVVEKLEHAALQCNVAIVLLTRDDVQASGELRARQNVVHEIGFFQGRYGRQRVILLAERGVEMFSNISGIVRVEFEPAHFLACYESLRREMKAAAASPLVVP